MLTVDILQQAGFTIRVDGDRLIVSPKSGLTDEVRAFIRNHKAEILAELTKPAAPSCHKEESGGSTPPPPESGQETTNPRYSRGDRIKFLGRHSRDVLEGEIIALLPPAPDGTPWYQVRTRNQIVCVSQNHIVEEIA